MLPDCVIPFNVSLVTALDELLSSLCSETAAISATRSAIRMSRITEVMDHVGLDFRGPGEDDFTRRFLSRGAKTAITAHAGSVNLFLPLVFTLNALESPPS